MSVVPKPSQPTESPQIAPSISQAEWVTKMSLLATSNRAVYREIRRLMWQFVVENSERSDFPSDMS